jgi:hypothetical protein
MAVGRTEYMNDSDAPEPNNLVPAADVLAVDAQGQVLLRRRRDTGKWAVGHPDGQAGTRRDRHPCAVAKPRKKSGSRSASNGGDPTSAQTRKPSDSPSDYAPQLCQTWHEGLRLLEQPGLR